MQHWAYDSIFYHIYPLGFCDAPPVNDFQSTLVPRLEKIYGWLDHIQELGVNAIYLGPIFESDAHGYDTADYYHIDRRLGNRQTMAALSKELHNRGIRLVLDGVFNHVGRHFWAFRDVQTNLQNSPYVHWFQRLDFEKRSPYGDPFSYEGWRGHYNLVKLNLHAPDVKAHLFGAIEQWVEDYRIDGLRLDVADDLLPEFMKELHIFSKNLCSDFWLMGEVARGDYNQWVNPAMLDSVTNYELRKGLYSTHNDNNYFEIAHTLNRQFGPSGLYANLMLYNFADNHDVSRVATSLINELHLFPLYLILFTIPGIPSLYYGSEWGIKATKGSNSDDALRPCLDLDRMLNDAVSVRLQDYLARLAKMRNDLPALRYGTYQQMYVSSNQFVFLRQWQGQSVLIALNSSQKSVHWDVQVPLPEGTCLVDWLQPEVGAVVTGGKLGLQIGPNEGRVFSTGG